MGTSRSTMGRATACNSFPCAFTASSPATTLRHKPISTSSMATFLKKTPVGGYTSAKCQLVATFLHKFSDFIRICKPSMASQHGDWDTPIHLPFPPTRIGPRKHPCHPPHGIASLACACAGPQHGMLCNFGWRSLAQIYCRLHKSALSHVSGTSSAWRNG